MTETRHGPKAASAARDDISLTTVPDVAGMPAADADVHLSARGFLVMHRPGGPSEVASGFVISTVPEAGAVVVAGGGLYLLVSSGPSEPPTQPRPEPGVPPGSVPPEPDLTTQPLFPVGTVAGPVRGAITDGCELFVQVILDLRVEIVQTEDRIVALGALLGRMHGRAGADPADVAALTAELGRLQDLLETDRAQLQAFSEEHSASCPPHPSL